MVDFEPCTKRTTMGQDHAAVPQTLLSLCCLYRGDLDLWLLSYMSCTAAALPAAHSEPAPHASITLRSRASVSWARPTLLPHDPERPRPSDVETTQTTSASDASRPCL